jgi:tripartite-type tricarboxylate transporter receptor subunit TctC
MSTLNEAGFANFVLHSRAGLFVPANTPMDVARRLNGDLRRIIDNSETRMRLAAVGFEGFSSTPAELGETAAVQLAKWTPMIRDAGIEAEQPPGRSHQIAA